MSLIEFDPQSHVYERQFPDRYLPGGVKDPLLQSDPRINYRLGLGGDTGENRKLILARNLFELAGDLGSIGFVSRSIEDEKAGKENITFVSGETTSPTHRAIEISNIDGEAIIDTYQNRFFVRFKERSVTDKEDNRHPEVVSPFWLPSAHWLGLASLKEGFEEGRRLR